MPRKERVTKVIDGDTLKTASRKNPVRLANVNAPEKGQRGYANAKSKLVNLVEGKEVIVDTVARDRYGRSVSRIYKNGKSVNKEMQRRLKK